jgi:hypothetical protein
VDQAATNASVAIKKRMDSLELGVSNCRLDDCRQVISVHELRQVLEKTFDVIGRRRNEFGIDGAIQTPADPVLPVSNRARDLVVLRLSQEGSMNGHDVVDM